MSLYRYFTPCCKPYLPNPEEEKTNSEASETKVVNEEVQKTLGSCNRKRKSTNNCFYDRTMRAEIGQFAAENGNKRAVEKFSHEPKRPLSESTVRGFKKAYNSELKKVKDPDKISELTHGARGRPVKLGDLDQKLQVYIGKLRIAGTPVNRSIVIAAARGMVMYHSPPLLPKRGGNLDLGRKWAESLMSRMGDKSCKKDTT